MEVAEATMEHDINISLKEDVTATAQSSMSPEYKSSWNDVNIQGDYDQYARSVAPSRLNNDATPPKQGNVFSPRPKDNDDINTDRSSPKKGRVKLNKIQDQSVKIAPVPPGSTHEITGTKNKREGANQSENFSGNSKSNNEQSESKTQRNDAENFPAVSKNDEHAAVNKELSATPLNHEMNAENMDQHQFTEAYAKTKVSSPAKSPRKTNSKQINADKQGSRISNKSSTEFTPPIVTAVDFREPALTEAVKFATKYVAEIGYVIVSSGHGQPFVGYARAAALNLHSAAEVLGYSPNYCRTPRNGLLVEGQDSPENQPRNGHISRLSTLLMASYLGMGYNYHSNLITSFTVKPLLPPLNPKNRPIRRRRVVKRNQNEADSNKEISEQKPTNQNADATSDNTKELAPLRGAHLFKWKHNPFVSHTYGNEERYLAHKTSYRLPKRDGDIENIFDQIVRWRSKVRHCGKPAMYRRITSPTPGEVALRKKLTDRLPSRQDRRMRPAVGELQPKEAELWRRPPSRNIANRSVKHFIKERLREAQKEGSLTSPAVIEGFCGVTMKQTTHQRKLDSSQQNEIVKLPLPDLSLRKRQPIWQRMR